MVPAEGLSELMGSCDYVLNCLPLTPHTHGFISRSHLEAMPAHGVFINIGRGPTVDEQVCDPTSHSLHCTCLRHTYVAWHVINFIPDHSRFKHTQYTFVFVSVSQPTDLG